MEANGNTGGHILKITNHEKLWEHEQIQPNGLGLIEYQCFCNNCNKIFFFNQQSDNTFESLVFIQFI
jgi:hypothetical protein